MLKLEYEDMAADLESGLAWSCADYVAQEMKRQRRALEEIIERRRSRDQGGVIVLSDCDEDGGPGQGCSKDARKDGPPSDGRDDGGGGDEYTAFYKLLSMN